jgi:hypothetical protein
VTLRFDEDGHRMFECLRTGKPMAQPTKDTGVRAATIRTWASPRSAGTAGIDTMPLPREDWTWDPSDPGREPLYA